MFFFLEGSVKVSYNEFSEKEFGAGEMIFMPQSADYNAVALTKCKFIVLIYDAVVVVCGKAWLDSMISHAKHVRYEFDSLLIRGVLNNYLQLLKEYLASGISCPNMFEIKLKELFLIFRSLYKIEELAQFFFPILGDSLNFRDEVMSNYPNAKTARDLAKLCGYSEGHFSRLFFAEFNDSPYKWMQKQMAKHVVGRLSQSQVPLKEIAEEFGFSSQSHFDRYCKSQFGASGASLRRKL